MTIFTQDVHQTTTAQRIDAADYDGDGLCVALRHLADTRRAERGGKASRRMLIFLIQDRDPRCVSHDSPLKLKRLQTTSEHTHTAVIP